jgi:hypothetical protein
VPIKLSNFIQTSRVTLYATAVAVAVCLIAISAKSLWIDEALTAVVAIQPTLHGWWQALVQEKTSDLQMPLYMLYMWGYEKLFGAGEWALRLANLPWYVVGAVSFMCAVWRFKPTRTAFLLSFLVLFSPFAWYYLDEARPYAMQIGASLLIAAALMRIRHAPNAHAGSCFVLGVLILCGSSLLGMIWAAASLAIFFLLQMERRAPTLRDPNPGNPRRWNSALLLSVCLLVLFGLYYLWTVKLGARAATGRTGPSSILFCAYELFGFGGLGPGRLQIRSDGFAAFRGHSAAVVLYGLLLLVVFGAAVLSRRAIPTPVLSRTERQTTLLILLCCAIPVVFILAAGLFLHFRVLGRHFAPILPALVLIMGSGLNGLLSARRLWPRVLAALFYCFTICSCVSLRFAPRHDKDDYRSAAEFARTALKEGRSVWWNAAKEGAQYYHLSFSSSSSSSTPAQPGFVALVLANPPTGSLDSLVVPHIILTSKPDLYDNAGTLQKYIREHGFQPVRHFTAFTVWQR